MKKFLFIILASAALFLSCSDEDNNNDDDDNSLQDHKISGEELREQTILAQRSNINASMSMYCSEIGKLGEDIYNCASKTFRDNEVDGCGSQINDLYDKFYRLINLCVSYCGSYFGTDNYQNCLTQNVLYAGTGGDYVNAAMTSGGLLEACYAQNNLGESIYAELKVFIDKMKGSADAM